MDVDYPTDEVPATPEYVLELFRDVFRAWDEPSELLSFDTTVRTFAADWNDTILFWRELARSLNDLTGLDLPVDEWKPVLSPMRTRTLRDVCNFVATQMGTRQAIRPWHYVAGDCLPAGGFLTTRSLLARCGADPKEITPSAPLEPYLLGHGFAWLEELYRLAPGQLPPLIVDRWFPACGCFIGVLVGGILMLLGEFLGKPGEGLQASGVLLLLIAIVVSLLVHRLSPRRIELGDLYTFRDLAYALAGQQPCRRTSPP